MENNKINPFSIVELYPNEHIKLMYPIPGLVDIPYNRYYITDFGRVFSILKRYNYEFYELKPSITQDGYLDISLSLNNQYKFYRLSRLVLFYFDTIPNNPNLYDANHKDFNRQNNHISNLEWLLHEDNVRYSYCNRDRVTDEQMIDIYKRIYEQGQSYEEVAKLYNRSIRTIIAVANGADRYKERHDALGLPDMRKCVTMTTKMVRDIYNDLLKGMSNADCHKKYGISLRVIGAIKLKKERYGELLKDLPDLEKGTNHKFSKEEALEIHNKIINSNLTNRELCEKFNITSLTLRDIKFCMNGYSFLIDMGAKIPDKGINHRDYSSEKLFKSKFDELSAVGIYRLIESGKSCSSIAKEAKCDLGTITSIKKCSGGYKYLKDKYGLEPLGD